MLRAIVHFLWYTKRSKCSKGPSELRINCIGITTVRWWLSGNLVLCSRYPPASRYSRARAFGMRPSPIKGRLSATLLGHGGGGYLRRGRRLRLLFAPAGTLVVRHLTIDLGHPTLIALTGATPVPARSLGHLLFDRLRTLEGQSVVNRRRREEFQVDRLGFGRFLKSLVLHRVVPAVD